jgi:hypothetical protein
MLVLANVNSLYLRPLLRRLGSDRILGLFLVAGSLLRDCMLSSLLHCVDVVDLGK